MKKRTKDRKKRSVKPKENQKRFKGVGFNETHLIGLNSTSLLKESNKTDIEGVKNE